MSISEHAWNSPLYDSITPSYSNDPTPPPKYGCDFTVEPVTLKNKNPQMLKFSLAGPPNRVLENREIIMGSLEVSPIINCKISSLTVSIECEEATMRPGWSHDYLLTRKIKLKTTEITNLPPDSTVMKGNLYSFPFSIQIPEFLDPMACSDITDVDTAVSDCHTRLPPTLGPLPDSPVPYPDVPSNVARVTYRLVAVLKCVNPSTGHVYTNVSIGRYINVIPSYSVSPEAFAPSPLPYRSFLEVTKSMGKLGTARRPICVAQLEVPQHPILSLSTKTVTMLPLSLKCYPSPGSEGAAPPPIKKLSVYLKSRTMLSHETSFKTLPSNLTSIKPVQIETSTSDVLNASKGISVNATAFALAPPPAGYKETFHTFLITRLTTTGFQWPNTPSMLTSSHGNRMVYSADFAVPLVMPSKYERSLVPNYHSCFTMRDYTLVVVVEFSSNNILNLEVPAIMVKNPIDVFPNSTPSYSETENEVLKKEKCAPASQASEKKPLPVPAYTQKANVLQTPFQDDLLVVKAFENKLPKVNIPKILPS